MSKVTIISAIAFDSSFPYRRPRLIPARLTIAPPQPTIASLRRWCIHAEGRMCPICSQNLAAVDYVRQLSTG
ncbi:hypothetical protein H6G97_49965 [Nostoc flagelliforme FACHB-838]|uniref:Uncharacterized protein n=1 Tax=Nostoc flagelliforme FACHB-838 TaxID=2692904 RepID=A0ABR8E5S4_9NOSO|nr:hypothetical protein [Nostoc flagelliforme]MBD2536914.1 hypothetical protein [Nostoc flagelliforme FACHB-838]